MLHIAGSIGLGLVWGWLVVRRVRGARWALAVRMLLWLAVQAVLVAKIASPQLVVWFAISTLASALICHAWLRSLARRYSSA